MKTERPISRAGAIAVLPFTFAALLLAGCGERLDKNPLFKDQMRITERLEEDQKAMTWQVDELVVDMKNLKQQLNALRQGASSITPAHLQALEGRIAALEQALAQARTELAAQRTAPAPAAAEKKRIAKRDSEAPSLPAEEPADAEPAAKPKKDEIAAANTSSAAPKPQPTRARVTPAKAESAPEPRNIGFYHMVKNGETFEVIAQRNSIPLNKLLASNKIPPGRSLFAGQQLWIPGK